MIFITVETQTDVKITGLPEPKPPVSRGRPVSTSTPKKRKLDETTSWETESMSTDEADDNDDESYTPTIMDESDISEMYVIFEWIFKNIFTGIIFFNSKIGYYCIHEQ